LRTTGVAYLTHTRCATPATTGELAAGVPREALEPGVAYNGVPRAWVHAWRRHVSSGAKHKSTVAAAAVAAAAAAAASAAAGPSGSGAGVWTHIYRERDSSQLPQLGQSGLRPLPVLTHTPALVYRVENLCTSHTNTHKHLTNTSHKHTQTSHTQTHTHAGPSAAGSASVGPPRPGPLPLALAQVGVDTDVRTGGCGHRSVSTCVDTHTRACVRARTHTFVSPHSGAHTHTHAPTHASHAPFHRTAAVRCF
jgi:hypothetical protein